MITTHRVRAALVVAVLGSVLLGGCGGDPTPEADPTPTASGSGSPSTDESPSDGGSASVEPATGTGIDTSFFTVQLPEGYRVRTLSKDFAYSAAEKGGLSYISLNVVDTYGNPRLADLDGVAALRLRAGTWQQKPKRQDDTELGGEPAYHFAGPNGDTDVDLFGSLHDGQSISISFDLSGSPAERQALVDSVLATWQWK